MVTARPQKQLKQAEEYFRKHLMQGDYYSENQSIAGHWLGRGAERLGLALTSPVTEEAYLRLCQNLHPLTGDKLTARTRKDRRIFYDFVVSAPKSVSIMAVTMGDERLITAHNAALASVAVELERLAAARVRRHGQRAARTTGEIIVAAFLHDGSRALDPQLHTHLLIFNATFDPVEKAWRALESEQMFANCGFLTEVYRNDLTRRLHALGYRTRPTANGFEIEGVSDELIRRFSKRRRAIEQAESRLTNKLGHKLSNNGRAALAHSTRARKREDLGSAALVAHQRSQLTSSEAAALQRLIVPNACSPEPRTPTPAAEELVQMARDHLFERRSVAAEHEVLKAALEFGRGQVELEDLRAALAKAPGLVRRGGELTTQDAIRQEKALIGLANEGVGRCPALHRGFRLSPDLSAEQRQVVETVLCSSDEVIGLRGGAGTGKTFALREIARGIQAKGRRVQMLAPTTGAVDVLRREGFQHADTVQRFLVDPNLEANLRDQVLIADEAGMMSVPQMLALVRLCRENRCRLILTGDARQHTSVEAGDAFRLLESRSHLHTARLNEIRRQTRTEYRQAIADIANGRPQRALARLEKLGAVLEIEGEERYPRLASDYVESVKLGKSALIVSPTWREIEMVTEATRSRLKNANLLPSKETPIEAHTPAGWTKAQKCDLAGYSRGLVLVFHLDCKEFRRGEWARVEAVHRDRLHVRKPDGQPVVITRKQTGCFDVAQRTELCVARGERLLLRAGRRDAGLLPGQLVTVKSVRRDGQIRLTDGRTIPPDFKLFTYGYCVTSQTAQGKTADHVYVAVDGKSGQAANLKQFYVSTSRGREQVKIYTDDVSRLREAIERTGDRISATEWIHNPPPTQKQSKGARVRPT